MLWFLYFSHDVTFSTECPNERNWNTQLLSLYLLDHVAQKEEKKKQNPLAYSLSRWARGSVVASRALQHTKHQPLNVYFLLVGLPGLWVGLVAPSGPVSPSDLWLHVLHEDPTRKTQRVKTGMATRYTCLSVWFMEGGKKCTNRWPSLPSRTRFTRSALLIHQRESTGQVSHRQVSIYIKNRTRKEKHVKLSAH